MTRFSGFTVEELKVLALALDNSGIEDETDNLYDEIMEELHRRGAS